MLLRLAGAAGISIIAPSLLPGCSGGTGASAPTYEATIAVAREEMRKAIADPALSSISAALVDGERIIWAEASGRIDAARTAPNTGTMFGIASVSKMVSTIAAMILVDRGLVQLDQPFVKYVTDFRMASPEYTQITVRMLLSHSSGLPGSEYRDASTVAPFPGYLDEVRQTMTMLRLKHAPGEMAVYCNDGFTMIEALVAARTGKSYVQFVQDEIFTPLAMSHSRYPLSLFTAGTYAPGFAGDTPLPQECLNVYGSGALWTTPSDMGRLAMMLINGGQLGGRRILSEQAVVEMGRDQSGALPLNPTTQTRHYGLGWDDVVHTGFAPLGIAGWQKDGDSAIYHSLLVTVPSERLGFFVVGASSKYERYAIAERILLQALAERGTIASVPVPLPATPLPEKSPADSQLAAIGGYYASHNSVMRIKAQPDRTLAMSSLGDGSWHDTAIGLKMRNDDTFSSDAEPLKSYRIVETRGLRYLVQRAPNGFGHYLLDNPQAQRIEPKAATSNAWNARIGKRWLAVNLDVKSVMWDSGGIGFEPGTVPELPGYVLNDLQITDATGSDTLAEMCLKIPIAAGSDLNDIVIETRSAEEWVRVGGTRYRPLETLPALSTEGSVVMIGSDAYPEWRKLPPSGTVSVSGATAWKLYDKDFVLKASHGTSGSAPPPGTGDAAYLLVFGAAGAVISVSIA